MGSNMFLRDEKPATKFLKNYTALVNCDKLKINLKKDKVVSTQAVAA